MSTKSFSTAFVKSSVFPQRDNPLEHLSKLNTPVTISTTQGWDASVPLRIHTDSRGSLKHIRQRTLGDELADKAAHKGAIPTTRAIRMANAILLEQILGTGEFASPAAFAKMIGVSRKLISELLAMLNQSPAEIEKILFETK